MKSSLDSALWDILQARDRSVALSQKNFTDRIVFLEGQLSSAAEEAQKHIDDLLSQLSQLTTNSQKTIDELMIQIDRQSTDAQKHIDDLVNQVTELGAISRQQIEHLSGLEKERARLASNETKLTEDSIHYLKVIEEQTAYIGILQRLNQAKA